MMNQPKHPRLGNRDFFRIVSAGRDVSWKGFEALKRVGKRHSHWEVIIGTDLPQQELHKLIESADVFVLNSTYEGLPHILIEVMHLAIPIIATNVGGIPELIKDKCYGLLIPPNDEEALYKALKDVETNTYAATLRATSAWQYINHGTVTEEKEINDLVSLALLFDKNRVVV